MDELKIKDIYDDFVVDTESEIAESPADYVDGHRDGAYDFFARLLGEPK